MKQEILEEALEQMNLIYEVMGRDEFAESIAKMLWNIYDKSKKVGFSDEQAFQIVCGFAKTQGQR